MRNPFILLPIALSINISVVSAQGRILQQQLLCFKSNQQYSIIASTEDDRNEDNQQYGGVTITLKEGDKEISHFVTFELGENCPADGFMGIKAKGNFFTIEDSYCDGWYFVKAYTTFRYDAVRKEIILHRYGESYINREHPEQDIPAKSHLVKKRIPFQKVNSDLLLGLRKFFR